MNNQKKMAGGVSRSPIVRCPTCKEKLKEILYVPVYRCPKCNTVFLANSWKSDKGVRNLDKHARVSQKKDVPKQKLENTDHPSKDESTLGNKEVSFISTNSKVIGSTSSENNISEKCIENISLTLNNESMPVRKNVDVISVIIENTSARDSPDNDSNNCEIMQGDSVMEMNKKGDHLAFNDGSICIRQDTTLCSTNKTESESQQANVLENLSKSSFSMLNDETTSQKSSIDSCSKDKSKVEYNSTQDSPGIGSINFETEASERTLLIHKEATQDDEENASSKKGLRDRDSEDGESLSFSQSEILSVKIHINETETMPFCSNFVINNSEACQCSLNDGLTTQNEETPFPYKCQSTTGSKVFENINILSERDIVWSGSEDKESTLNQELEGLEYFSLQKCLPDDGSENSQHALNDASLIASVEGDCYDEDITKIDNILSEFNLDHFENNVSSSKEDPSRHEEKASSRKTLQDNDSEDDNSLYFSQSKNVSNKTLINETETMSYTNVVIDDCEASQYNLDDGFISRSEEVSFAYKCQSTTCSNIFENISILSMKNMEGNVPEDEDSTLNQELEGLEYILPMQKCLPDDGFENSQHAVNGSSLIAGVETDCYDEDITKLDNILSESNLDHFENHDSSSKEDPSNEEHNASSCKSLQDNDSEDSESLYFSRSEFVSYNLCTKETEIMPSCNNAVNNVAKTCQSSLDDGLLSKNEMHSENIVVNGSEDNASTFDQEVEGSICTILQKSLSDDDSENSQHALKSASLVTSSEVAFHTEDDTNLDNILPDYNLNYSENHESSSKENPSGIFMQNSPTISEAVRSENVPFQNNTSDFVMLQNGANISSETVLNMEAVKFIIDGGKCENLDMLKNGSSKFPSLEEFKHLSGNVTMDMESESISTLNNSSESHFENGVTMDGEINPASIKTPDCMMNHTENKNLLLVSKHIFSDSEFKGVDVLLLDESMSSSMEDCHPMVDSTFGNKLHLIGKESDQVASSMEVVPYSTTVSKHASISSLEDVAESENDFSFVEKEMGSKLNEGILLKNNSKIVIERRTCPISVRKNFSSSHMSKRISSPVYMDMSILENVRPSLNCEPVQKTMKIVSSSADGIKHDSLLSTSNQTLNDSETKGSLINLEIFSGNEEIKFISGRNEASNTDFEKEENGKNNELNPSGKKGAACNLDPGTGISSVSTEHGMRKGVLADEAEHFSLKQASSKEVMRPETTKCTELSASRKESKIMQRNLSQTIEGDTDLQIDLMLETATLFADNTVSVSFGKKSDSSLEEINDQEAILSHVVASDICSDESEFLLDDQSLLKDIETSSRADSMETKNNSTWREASKSTKDDTFLNRTSDFITAEIEFHDFCTVSKNDTASPKTYVPEGKMNNVMLCTGQNGNLLKDAKYSYSNSSENSISECSTSKDRFCLDHGSIKDNVSVKLGQSISDETNHMEKEISFILSQGNVAANNTDSSDFSGNDGSSSLNKDIEKYLFGTSAMFTVARDQKNFPEKDMDREVEIAGQKEVNSQNGTTDASLFSVGNGDVHDQHTESERVITGDQVSSSVRTFRSLRSLIKSESVVLEGVPKIEMSDAPPKIECLQENSRASTVPKVRRTHQIIGNSNYPPEKSYDLNFPSQIQVDTGKHVSIGAFPEDLNLHDGSRRNKISHPSEKVKIPKPLCVGAPRKVDLLRNQHMGSTVKSPKPLHVDVPTKVELLRNQHMGSTVKSPKPLHVDVPRKVDLLRNQHMGSIERKSSLSKRTRKGWGQPQKSSPQRETMASIHKFNNVSETSSPQLHRRSHHHLQSSARLQQNQQRYTKHNPLSYQNTRKNGHEIKKPDGQARKQVIKVHIRPILGGLQYVICYHCLELLQIPQDFHFGRKKENKLQCGACFKVLKFSLDSTHISPFISNQRLQSDG